MSSQAAGVRDKSSKKISFACEECKRRRSRCSGPPRCERCDTDNTPCIFDAGKDLRTRQSRDADKVHKALLDAFAAAVQGQDDKISHILYDIIRKTDPSGKLAESVQIGTAITTTSTTDTTHVNTPTAVLNSRGSGIRPEDCVPWEWLRAQDFQAHRAGQLLPGFSCDPYNVEPADALSRAYLAFRDAARRQLLTGARTVPELINGPLPVLDQFFGTAPNTNPLSPWTYACQLAGTMTDFPFTLKLATIYVTGLLMRVCSRAQPSVHSDALFVDDVTVLYSALRRDLPRPTTHAAATATTVRCPTRSRCRLVSLAQTEELDVRGVGRIQRADHGRPKLQLALQ